MRLPDVFGRRRGFLSRREPRSAVPIELAVFPVEARAGGALARAGPADVADRVQDGGFGLQGVVAGDGGRAPCRGGGRDELGVGLLRHVPSRW